MTVNVTNSTDLSGVTNRLMAMTNMMAYETNVLGQVQTNNQYSAILSNLVNGTNITLGTGSNLLGSGVTGQAQSLVDALGNGSWTNTDAGDASVLSIGFVGGTTLNLDPEVRFPGIGGLVKSLFGWAATFAFLFWFGTRYWAATQLLATAQTGGVPDLETEALGFGGNILGVVTALVIPFVLVGLWVTLFTGIFSIVLGVTGGSGYWGFNPFFGWTGFHSTHVAAAGGSTTYATGSGAMYLLNYFLPVPYILSLGWTQLVLYFTMAKVALVCAAASRALWGR